MSASREQILNRLRAAQPLFEIIEAIDEPIRVTPTAEQSPDGLIDIFIEQSRLLSSVIHLPISQIDAIQVLMDLLGEDKSIFSWDFDHIPLAGLQDALTTHGIQVADERDATVRVGITGVDAALAATGSLVLLSGAGKPRLASLLPPVHIAILHKRQILADMESWVTSLRQTGLNVLQATASAIIISGPSRTADIAMQLILGMHGPGELHIIILS